jgi:methionyl-tRNA formyltransferase
MSRVLLLSPYADRLASPLADDDVEVFDAPLTIELLDQMAPQWVISYGYRYIVRQPVVSALRGRIINLHISYLPWNRGADPNFWSFFDGTPKGVSIHLIDNGIDTGDILAQKETNLGADETLETTYSRLQQDMLDLFQRMWPDIKAGNCQPVLQNGASRAHTRKDLDILRPLLPLGWKTPVSHVIKLGQRLRERSEEWPHPLI